MLKQFSLIYNRMHGYPYGWIAHALTFSQLRYDVAFYGATILLVLDFSIEISKNWPFSRKWQKKKHLKLLCLTVTTQLSVRRAEQQGNDFQISLLLFQINTNWFKWYFNVWSRSDKPIISIFFSLYFFAET